MPESVNDTAAPPSAPANGGGDAAGHRPFDLNTAILQHNMPYPAWEITHGRPLLVFNRGQYAAINYEALKHHPAYPVADGTPYREWAADVAATGDFRHDHERLEVDALAKTMAVLDHGHGLIFPRFLGFFNHQTFCGLLALTLVTLLLTTVWRRRADQPFPRGRVQHAIEALVVYFRDEVVKPQLPHDHRVWLPVIVALFLVVLTANLFGLVPGTGTMTSNIGVTAGFATAVFAALLLYGMKRQGPIRFWINLVPMRFSIALSPIWLLMFASELLGLLIKPFALSVRLFANMFAGHTALLIMLSLGYIIVARDPSRADIAAGVHGLGLFIGIAFHALEVLVAVIQAYIFAMLSTIFIGMSLSHGH